MNLNEVKFFIGPMSKNIVDTLVDFSTKENYKIGIVASRRQVDWDGGYANNWNTQNFYNYLVCKRDNLIVERDHGGINQGRYYDNGTMSFYMDAINGFDIIHVDPWNNYSDFQRGLDEIVDNIKFISKINGNCLFEVGTEESIYSFDEVMLDNMLSYLKDKLSILFKKIVYCVIQSGTKLVGIQNTGNFNINRLKRMIDVCNKYEILSKEHNGDYLSSEDIKIRFDAGLSAINIAPEFGVFETDVILKNITENQKETFFNICYNSNKWVKWVTPDFNPHENKEELIRICGHYQFSTPEFIKMNLNLDNIIKEQLYKKLEEMSKLRL